MRFVFVGHDIPAMWKSRGKKISKSEKAIKESKMRILLGHSII